MTTTDSKPTPHSWSAEDDKKLTKLWGSELTTAQVSVEMGLSAGSVRARGKRLGYPNRPPAPPASVQWPDARIELLTALWREGLSASQIAKRMGHVSRNGVLSKVHRLGIQARDKPAAPKAKPVDRQNAERAPKAAGLKLAPNFAFPAGGVMLPTVPVAPTVPKLRVLPMKCEPVEMLNLEPHHCRWPVGEDGKALSCGARREPGGPYCPDHADLAWPMGRPKQRELRPFREGAKPVPEEADRDLVQMLGAA